WSRHRDLVLHCHRDYRGLGHATAGHGISVAVLAHVAFRRRVGDGAVLVDHDRAVLALGHPGNLGITVLEGVVVHNRRGHRDIGMSNHDIRHDIFHWPDCHSDSDNRDTPIAIFHRYL